MGVAEQPANMSMLPRSCSGGRDLNLWLASLITLILLLPSAVAFLALTATPAVVERRQIAGYGRNQTTSTFWVFDHWGRVRSSGYCEPLQASAVLEPINSWSNYAYIVVGAVTISLATRDMRSTRVLEQRELRAHPGFACLMGLTWVLLGVFSFLFHAAHVTTFWILDVAFTNNAAAALLFWSALSLAYTLRPPPARLSPWLTAATAVALVILEALFIVYKRKMSAVTSVSALIGLIILIEVVVQPLACGKTRRQMAWTLTSLLFMLVAFLVRNAETSWGRPLCLYSTWFQPHAVW